MAAGSAPPDKLHGINPAVARLGLMDERMGLLEPLAKLPLRKAGVQPPFSQQFAQFTIRRVVLRSCSHEGDTL